eukprot:6497049-Alexandrium_andersonii.AAC.1
MKCEGAPGGTVQGLANARVHNWRRRRQLLEWHRATCEVQERLREELERRHTPQPPPAFWAA